MERLHLREHFAVNRVTQVRQQRSLVHVQRSAVVQVVSDEHVRDANFRVRKVETVASVVESVLVQTQGITNPISDHVNEAAGSRDHLLKCFAVLATRRIRRATGHQAIQVAALSALAVQAAQHWEQERGTIIRHWLMGKWQYDSGFQAAIVICIGFDTLPRHLRSAIGSNVSVESVIICREKALVVATAKTRIAGQLAPSATKARNSRRECCGHSSGGHSSGADNGAHLSPVQQT
eukprot:1056247-Rhodomonas_salina.1